MRIASMVLLGAVACKGTPTETDSGVNCNTEQTQPLTEVPVQEWPAGLEDAITALTSLDGRYTATACGDTDVNVSIRTPSNAETATLVDVITVPLQPGHDCGCTIDTVEPKDGDLTAIAYSTMDIFVEEYPREGFREENAGNVSGIPVTLFTSSGGLVVRGCTTELVPPILQLPWTDNDIVFRSGTAGISMNVRLFGEGISDDACTLTNFTRVGDN